MTLKFFKNFNQNLDKWGLGSPRSWLKSAAQTKTEICGYTLQIYTLEIHTIKPSIDAL